ncbi:MAG TPA: restriction endonuclease subunit R, partial [Firmicutes bacterium]|nr:restriction endonuclease subunit R [Bacillota bacterium]
LKPYQTSIIEIANSILKGGSIEIENGKKPKVFENKLNQNFDRKEFKELWDSINHKYSYRVSFSSDELVENCISRIKKELEVSKITYSVDVGEQKDAIAQKDIDNSFQRGADSGKKEKFHVDAATSAKYDLVHEIAQRTHLTRRTIVRILVGTKEKLQMFRDNPEEYITKISNLIDEEKASVIVRGIRYNKIDGHFDDTIFNEKHVDFDPQKAFPSKKAIQDYVFVDGSAKGGNSNEMLFARKLEQQQNVKVYAKMPKGFYIPTPMGRYSPDWAIVYESDGERGVYFIAETKGSLDSLSLRKIEESKINCAKSLYNQPSSKVNYDLVHTYDDLVTKVMNILEKHNGEQS